LMPFACNSSVLSVDGMTCQIPFSRSKNALSIAIQYDSTVSMVSVENDLQNT
jgi:hypothetical protein